jgi:bifunctional DNA-binding transcriptional regulator/antitoxin component of YhaV-PrlF toxin-antitoxin module
VILPKEALSRLRLEKSQSVFLTETPDGLVLTPFDPALEDQIQAGRAFMRDFRDTFHQLAK